MCIGGRASAIMGAMNKRELAKAVAVQADVELKTVVSVIDGFTDVVTAVVSKGEPVSIPGFAKFVKVNRAARMGRNPATGEAIRIKASKKARITPVKAFKDAVLAPATAPKLVKGAYPIGYAPFTSFGAVAGARTASLNALTGVMRAFLEALIRMASPVAGLRPMRAARFTLTNLAKPGMETGSPFETTAVTTSVNPSMTETTVFNSTSAWTATAFASSLLFMAPIMADARPPMHIFPGTNADICAQTCSNIT